MLAEAAGDVVHAVQLAPARRTLTAAVVDVADLSRRDRWRMFAIYQAHYEAATWARFAADLDEKMYVVLAHNDAGVIQGFTTLSVLETSLAGARLRAIYSGDTIIDRDYWGSQQLAFTWIRFAGCIKAVEPQTPLYWFLIVKGHRTYRYLSAFSETFYPHWAYETPADMRALMHRLGNMRFGEFYRPETGVIRFPESHGHLKPELAVITPTEAQRPDVAFFLASNPGYAAGHELLCIAELCAENLRPHARKHFLEGLRR